MARNSRLIARQTKAQEDQAATIQEVLQRLDAIEKMVKACADALGVGTGKKGEQEGRLLKPKPHRTRNRKERGKTLSNLYDGADQNPDRNSPYQAGGRQDGRRWPGWDHERWD